MSSAGTSAALPYAWFNEAQSTAAISWRILLIQITDVPPKNMV